MGGRDPAELRALPAVHELASKLDGAPHALAISAARQTIEQQRAAIRTGAPLTDDLVAAARERLAHLDAPSLRRVLNATGIVLHTNLGRAPLAPEARRAMAVPAADGYSALELDLARVRAAAGARRVEAC